MEKENMDKPNENVKIWPVGTNPDELKMEVTAHRSAKLYLREHVGTVTAKNPDGTPAEYQVSQSGLTFIISPEKTETGTDRHGNVGVKDQFVFNVADMIQAVAGKIHMNRQQQKETSDGNG